MLQCCGYICDSFKSGEGEVNATNTVIGDIRRNNWYPPLFAEFGSFHIC